MDIAFSRYIKLPSDVMNWSKENEGSERILIDLETTEATETILYD